MEEVLAIGHGQLASMPAGTGGPMTAPTTVGAGSAEEAPKEAAVEKKEESEDS